MDSGYSHVTHINIQSERHIALYVYGKAIKKMSSIFHCFSPVYMYEQQRQTILGKICSHVSVCVHCKFFIG